MELPTDEMLLANAIKFLIDGQHFYEAGLLLLCNIETEVYNTYRNSTSLIIQIIGSRAIYEIIRGNEQSTNSRIVIENIKQSFNVILPSEFYVEGVTARVQLINFDSSWRPQLMESLDEQKILNQGLPIQKSPRFPWKNLYFRSPHEIAIAKALDEYNVFFLPNCMARFGSVEPKERKNREADFIVCYDGKWGIIEVDGEGTHTNAACDHDRDRLFRSHRVRVIERFTAQQCINEPEKVVREFLQLLQKNG